MYTNRGRGKTIIRTTRMHAGRTLDRQMRMSQRDGNIGNTWLETLLVLACFVQGLSGYCKTLELKNAVYQVSRNGVYNVLPKSQWCSPDRSSFQQSGVKDNYLYYIDIDDGWRGWMIGSGLCQNLGGIAAAGSAMAPEEVPRGGWEEVFSGDWKYNHAMVTVCQNSLSTSAIVAVSVTGIILTGVIVGISLCCFMKNKTKFTNTTNGSRTSNTGRLGRSPIATISGHQNTDPSSQVPTIGPGHAIPTNFVHVAAPPPYEDVDYKCLPPPTYDNAVLNHDVATSIGPVIPPVELNGPLTSGGGGSSSPPPSYRSPLPPPLSSPLPPPQETLSDNAHTNPAFEADTDGRAL